MARDRYEIEDIPLKYSEYAVIPDEIVYGYKHNRVFRCRGGEIVTLEYNRTCNNSKGRYSENLNDLCMEVYNMPFLIVKSAWERRIGRLSGYWHHVRLIKQ